MRLFFVSKYGQYYNAKDGKCVIFPKGKTTWEGFHRPFKDGDVITCTNSCCTFVSIFKERMDENIFVRYCAFILDDNKLKVDTAWSDFEKPRLATEEEKQKLFDAIKDNGYKWNEETKTLEKLIEPKFKVGNKIKEINSNEYVVLITDITDDYYIGETEYCMKVAISMNMQNNYELVPNKFDITTLKPLESADMYYWCGELIRIGSYNAIGIDDDIPCWSLAALLDIIPKEVKIKGQKYAPCLFPITDSNWLYKLWYNSNEIIESPISVWCDNPVDTCYETILKLHELNLL